jgi:lipopolysaccharide transport protein LptA
LIGKRRFNTLFFGMGLWACSLGSALPLHCAEKKPQSPWRVTDPIEIRADRLEFRRQEHVAVYQGDVTASQEDYVLRCRRLEVIWNPQTKKIARVIAKEAVELQTGRGTATSGQAVLDIAAQTITLTDSPRLVHGKESVEGGTIIYSITQRKSTVLADKDQRVRSRVLPKEIGVEQ